MITVGFDTSNYTTSVAAYDGTRVVNCSRLLKVRSGELGLRQSDALFLHVQNLPELETELFEKVTDKTFFSIAASTRPRAVEGSYMPCFLAGRTAAIGLSAAIGSPMVSVSHQQGHLAAVLYSANRMDLLEEEFLAWHLSGGTTELLHVSSNKELLHCDKIGGTTDISAGQIIDRTGLFLGADFPAGKHLDHMAQNVQIKDKFVSKMNGTSFSFSGLENKMQAYAEKHTKEETAAYVLRSVCETVKRATLAAREQYGNLPVIFSGGVASNTMLRNIMLPQGCIFGTPEFSTDNAGGTAVLGWVIQKKNGL